MLSGNSWRSDVVWMDNGTHLSPHIQRVTNEEFVKLNMRKKLRQNRERGYYNEARILSKEVIKQRERKEVEKARAKESDTILLGLRKLWERRRAITQLKRPQNYLPKGCKSKPIPHLNHRPKRGPKRRLSHPRKLAGRVT